MRLVPTDDGSYEVHYQGHMIGMLRLYRGEWHATLKDGTKIGAAPEVFADLKAMGHEVESAHKRRS